MSGVMTFLRKRFSRGEKTSLNYRSSKCLTVSLDLWPPRDWFRLKLVRWNPGQYAQLYVGPFRVDFFQG